MVNIIIAGAGGRMGRAIINVLPSSKNIRLVGAVEAKGSPDVGKDICGVTVSAELSSVIDKCDVLIDFTGADASIAGLETALAARKAVVMGATGHNDRQQAKIKKAAERIPVVCSPNMSVGVNVMWEVIKKAALLLGKNYQVDIVETHHVHKKDAPSGTAKKMIEMVASSGGYDMDKDVFFHVEGVEPPKEGNNIRVKSIREGEVVGDHTIIFTSPYERLEIAHRAFSREVFASGALRAAEWVHGRPAGLYDMRDVIEIE